MSQTRKLKLIPFYKTLFLDVILDSRTRPIFLYTLLMIIIGATVYHLLEGWSWLGLWRFSADNVFDQVDYDILCSEWRYSPVDAVRCRPECAGLVYLLSANSMCWIR